MEHIKTFESFLNEELGDEFNVSSISRSDLRRIIDILSDADISYDFDGREEMLSFDSTELDKGQIQALKKLGLSL
jgi:hypothetical protein